MSTKKVLPLAAAPTVPPPGDFVAKRAWKADRWTSNDGVTRRLEDMETEHLWNVLGYLRWHAPELREASTEGIRASQLSLRTWLTNLPIWRGISRELLRRGEVRDPAVVLELLEGTHRVPWQEQAAA